MKSEKERRINASLYDAVLYLSILHTNGASPVDAVLSTAEHAPYFGEAAEEFCQAVTDMDCGLSLFEALDRLAETTPSKKLRLFLSGYISAVQATGSAVPYLDDAVETLREEKRTAQKQYLSSLSIFAEIYLTLFVAAPLFAVIALMVLSMISGIDPMVLALFMMVVLPLGTVCFLILLDSLEVTPKHRHQKIPVPESFLYQNGTLACEGETELFQKLKTYDRKQKRLEFFRHKTAYFSDKPAAVFFISVPAAILTSTISFFGIHSLYCTVALALLVAFVPFAVFSSRNEKTEQAVESSMPDFLRRLADTVSRGMPLAKAVHLAVEEDKSPIHDALYRISSDIRFGDEVPTAFLRFAERMKLASVDRVVIMITETCRFATDTSKTLTIAASETKSRCMMMQERRSEMSLYLGVIYIGFFVFLFVMVILSTVFFDAMALSSGAAPLGIESFPVSVYETILAWSVMVHGICSGVTAGKMGTGSLVSGVKHVCVLVAIGTGVILLSGSIV